MLISDDITKAETLPASFYLRDEQFELVREKVFTKSWQWIGNTSLVQLDESVHPFNFLENFVDEPMLLTRDKNGSIRNLSNVCTHRGNILIHNPSKASQLICAYHGRRFDMEGNFKHMPEFQDAQGFPRPCEDLHTFPLVQWNSFLFTGIDPCFDINPSLDLMYKRVGFLPLEQFKFDPSRSKDYLVNAHWALYCDNYLEGFHIPFVHKDLNQALDYGTYSTEIYDHMNLQIGYASGGNECFNFPKDHIDYGKEIAAYYYWIFPNMMFNFYPWGLSINCVKPLSKERTRVSFLTYIYDESKLGKGAGALLDKVEREDEFVVEGVQKGIKSRFYKTGRFSPSKEKGPHHFHGLLSKFLAD